MAQAHTIKCDVCNAAITDPTKARVVGHPFGDFIERLHERGASVADIANGKHAGFANAVTRCYFIQFEEFESKTTSGDIRDFAADEQRRFDPVHRVEAVLATYPKSKDLWLVLHDGCIPEEAAAYAIRLDRIDTAAKALDWTFHVGEKMQFNAKGWLSVLSSIFGRRPVA